MCVCVCVCELWDSKSPFLPYAIHSLVVAQLILVYSKFSSFLEATLVLNFSTSSSFLHLSHLDHPLLWGFDFVRIISSILVNYVLFLSILAPCKPFSYQQQFVTISYCSVEILLGWSASALCTSDSAIVLALVLSSASNWTLLNFVPLVSSLYFRICIYQTMFYATFTHFKLCMCHGSLWFPCD